MQLFKMGLLILMHDTTICSLFVLRLCSPHIIQTCLFRHVSIWVLARVDKIDPSYTSSVTYWLSLPPIQQRRCAFSGGVCGSPSRKAGAGCITLTLRGFFHKWQALAIGMRSEMNCNTCKPSYILMARFPAGSRSPLIYDEDIDAHIMPQKTTKPKKVVSKRENPKKNKGNKK